jgi:hypothetical protein
VIDTVSCPIDYVSIGRFNVDKGCQVMRSAAENKSGQTAGIMLDFSKAGGGLIPRNRGYINLYSSHSSPEPQTQNLQKEENELYEMIDNINKAHEESKKSELFFGSYVKRERDELTHKELRYGIVEVHEYLGCKMVVKKA